MSQVKPLSIVVVNWNAGSQLQDMVNSIVSYHNGLVDSVVIVDNGSTDNSLAFIGNLGHIPFHINLLKNVENRGFAAACNQGAHASHTEFILFLNPDAAVCDSTLPRMVAFMREKKNSRVGICGVQLLDERGHVARSCSRFPSLLGFLAHAVAFDRLIPGVGNSMADWDHSTSRQVDQVIGACFLVRRAVFDKLHGFDERYFVYFEEVDFSYRALKDGWTSFYLADTQAFHAGGGTSNQVKARRLFYSLRSRILYADRHFHVPQFAFLLLLTFIVEPASRLALALMRRSLASFKETCAAYGLLFRWLPQWLFKGITR
jgi:GT2 family glycosyltransferase